MKITIATGLYPPEIGGPATYTKMLEEELPDQGFELTVVPFNVTRHYPKLFRHLLYTVKLWQASKGADVVYALDPVSVGVPALLVARLRAIPFVVRLGGDYAWEQGRVRFGVTDTLDEFWEQPKTWPLFVRLLVKIQTFVVKQTKRIVVPSAYLKKVVEKWGVPAEQITVIYSALYPLQVAGTHTELRDRLQYTYPTIVSAGRLVPWKGFSALINVTARLRADFPEIKLLIAGEGVERAVLEKQVTALGLEEQVLLSGSLSKTVLGETIKAANVFVLNTAYEGLSHQLLEVMDLGVPVVTTTAGGNTELINDGVNGLLVDFNNEEELLVAITRVLEHDDLRQRLVQSARLRAKEFERGNFIQKLVDVLHSL